MLRASTTPSPVTYAPGSGRSVDMVFPHPQMWNVFNGLGFGSYGVRSSIGIGGPTVAVASTGSGSFGGAFRNGRRCFKLGAGASQGNGQSLNIGTSFGIGLPVVRSGIPQGLSEFGVIRVVVGMAFDAVPGVESDYGFAFVDGLSTIGMIANAKKGFGIYRINTGQVVLDCLNGAHTVIPLLYPNLDPTAWNLYEMRFFEAHSKGDAILKVFVNGLLMQTIGWGAGTPLPAGQDPLVGLWHFQAVNLAGPGCNLFVENVRYVAGATEAACL